MLKIKEIKIIKATKRINYEDYKLNMNIRWLKWAYEKRYPRIVAPFGMTLLCILSCRLFRNSQEIIYGNITRIWQLRIMNCLPVATNAEPYFII